MCIYVGVLVAIRLGVLVLYTHLQWRPSTTKRTKVELITTLRVYMPIQWRPCTYTEVHPSISHLHEDCVESTQIKKWESIPLP